MLTRIWFSIVVLLSIGSLNAQENYDALKVEEVKPVIDKEIADLIKTVSADSIKSYIASMVSFETRHSLSDTVSNTKGIGAARRWVGYKFNQFALRNNAKMTVELIPTESNLIPASRGLAGRSL